MDEAEKQARRLSFGAVADTYAASRASYPEALVRWCLPEGARHVLDLGAGTGKLTSVLLDLGLQVTAVEPDDGMRAHVDPRATSSAGSAEHVPLADGSVDAVVVGQAWHWFEPEAASREIARVLRPGGTVGLLWNVFDDRVPWVAEVCAAFGAEDRLSFEAGSVAPELPPTLFTSPEQRVEAHGQAMTPDLLVTNVASRSGVVLLDDARRAAVLDRVRAAAPAASFDLPWVCEAWRAVRT